MNTQGSLPAALDGQDCVSDHGFISGGDSGLFHLPTPGSLLEALRDPQSRFPALSDQLHPHLLEKSGLLGQNFWIVLGGLGWDVSGETIRG